MPSWLFKMLACATCRNEAGGLSPRGQTLIGEELLHARVPQHTLGLEMPHPHPKLGSKPSRSLKHVRLIRLQKSLQSRQNNRVVRGWGKIMAPTKLLYDTFRFTVIRRNDGSIEIAPKNDPGGTRIYRKRAKRYELELVAAHHREGIDGIDRLCRLLLTDW